MKKEILNYYDEFIKNADYALETATILKEYVNNFDSNISEEMENKVHAFEKEADKNVHKILNYLIKDFLPSIDREDIVRLVHRIDDFIDSIDEVVINIDILDVTILRDDINKFIDLPYNGCISLKEMM